MKFDLQVDTKNMTKEERLAIKQRLQDALAELDDELDAMVEENPLSNEAVNSNSSNFFGVVFDFESMSKEELHRDYDEARSLWTAISLEEFPNSRSQTSKFFFDVEFNFWNMTREQFSSTKEEVRQLLRTIEKYL